MTHKLFFSYYLDALKKALSQDDINHGFLVKSPSWFYPEELDKILGKYEESHYEEFPVLEKVGYYFDAKSHNFPSIQGINIDIYRGNIIQEAKKIALEYDILFDI